MSNPLQELAEKLRNLCPGCRDGLVIRDGVHLFANGHRHEQHIDTAEIAAAVGTLLQAERAATIDLALTAFKKEFGEAQRSGLDAIGAVDCALDVVTGLATPDSALSAVVQRETEKLREEVANLKMLLGQAHTMLDKKDGIA